MASNEYDHKITKIVCLTIFASIFVITLAITITSWPRPLFCSDSESANPHKTFICGIANP